MILTWTSAEWSALDHVFLNSDTPRRADDWEWKKAWLPYSRASAAFHADDQSGALWGSFQLVRILDRSQRPWRVLLFKSNAHLAHPPWIEGLTAMLRAILADSRPDRIYSIGTAGGSRLDQHLGDAVITNAAMMLLQRPDNASNPGNGGAFRCRSWFPSTALLTEVANELLFPLGRMVTPTSLNELFTTLREKHPHDPGLARLKVEDLINGALDPANLGKARVHALRDVPLLTTDFYYIAEGNNATAYAFLEMDDAVIAQEAERASVRYAFVRNISDPIVRVRAGDGERLSEAVRGDWSGLIYQSFGLHTSHNGALATWATIAGQGAAAYNPPRSTNRKVTEDPLEVRLVREVRACGDCSFFWPKDRRQPYGPYTAYDFDTNSPYTAPGSRSSATPWALGRTRPPAFPNPEVVDGCRKAPIMTIGINPNLTAFAPGTNGAAWCYPDFASGSGSDAWAKYAWYYRYRSVWQERLDFDFARRFILPEGRVLAPRDGRIVRASRPDDSAAFTVTVRYDGDTADTEVPLPGRVGDFPYVLLFDQTPPRNVFRAGDTLAGRLAVPEGIQVEVLQAPQAYYLQFAPVLDQFEQALRKSGHDEARLKIGEDVCQLDMVACASPHWNPGFLGGFPAAVAQIVENCVRRNAWAMKQLVQTRPVVLFLVGMATWEMFRDAFGAHVRREPPLSSEPVDHDFTLLRETTDPRAPCHLELDVSVDGQRYQCSTRLVITPHFSYDTNFVRQFRLPPPAWSKLQTDFPAAVAFLTPEHGFTVVAPDAKYPRDFQVVQLPAAPAAAAAALAGFEAQFPEARRELAAYEYDPHRMMGSVLEDLLSQGRLRWQENPAGAKHGPTGWLARSDGSCRFCVNDHWQFPLGCPYGKLDEPTPPPGFLERVAANAVATGRRSSDCR